MAVDQTAVAGGLARMVEGSAITEEMRKAIGSLTLPEFPAEDVTIWGILRYIAATEDPNPLWRDEAYAGVTRWGGVIAPPTFVEVFSPLNRTMRETGGELVNLDAPFEPPFERQLLAGEEFEFFVPVRPGDSISSRVVLGDIYEKKSQSTSGALVFMLEDKDYRNQRDELLAKVRWRRVFVEIPPPAALAPPPPVSEGRARPATIHTTQVCFEDVEVGMGIPCMEKDITATTIAKWAGATGDVGPPHLDAEFVQKVYGLPRVFAHGPLIGAYLAQLITNWIGGWGILRKHSTQYRGSVFAGETVTFSGKVIRKWADQDDRLIECETWAENGPGERVALGKSIASLPANETGFSHLREV